MARKIKRAVTDTDNEVRYDPAAKPGVSNLLSILAACHRPHARGLRRATTPSTARSRPTPPTPWWPLLEPIQARYRELAADPAATTAILAAGADKARSIAGPTLAGGPSCNLGLR